MSEQERALIELRFHVSLLKRHIEDLRLVVVELRAKDEHLQEQITGMSDDLEEVEAVVQP